jgi:CBS domain-containing protein
MKTKISTVGDHMTFPLYTIDCREALVDATETMRRLRVHHLLVLDRQRPIGIISERDIFRLEARKAVVPEVLAVAEAMSPELVTVSADAGLADVARQMASENLGSVAVGTADQIIGIFTTTDALLALAALAEVQCAAA